MSSQGDISSIIEQIIKNPEFSNLVSGLKGGGENKSTEETTKDMLARLPEVLSMVSPMISNEAGTDTDQKTNNKPSEATQASISTTLPKKYDKAKAEKLLYALKPYMNTERCGIIDKCVSVMQLTDVVGVLQGLEQLKKNDP